MSVEWTTSTALKDEPRPQASQQQGRELNARQIKYKQLGWNRALKLCHCK